MKRIGIDARLYSQTGVGTYLRNLLSEFERLIGSDTELFVYLVKHDFERVTFHNPAFVKRKANFKWHSLSEQLPFYLTLRKDRLDLMHFTYFGYPVLYTRPFVATIHDVTPLVHKTGRASTRNGLVYEAKYHVFRRVLASQVRGARTILVPSLAIKSELKNIYGDTIDAKVEVTYEGVDRELMNQGKTGEHSTKTPFFLYVGNFYPHKNVSRLIDAFGKIPEPYRLFLVGPLDPFAEKLKEHVRELKIEGRVSFYHDVSSHELASFYQSAAALVHPSLAEGFGLPLIEATYFHLPIVASDIPVFREIAGDRYLRFDPTKTEEISFALKRFLSRPGKAPDFDNRFSFATMAKETLAVYRKNLT